MIFKKKYLKVCNLNSIIFWPPSPTRPREHLITRHVLISTDSLSYHCLAHRMEGEGSIRERSGGTQVLWLLVSHFGSGVALALPCHFCLVPLLSCPQRRQEMHHQSNVGKRKDTLKVSASQSLRCPWPSSAPVWQQITFISLGFSQFLH